MHRLMVHMLAGLGFDDVLTSDKGAAALEMLALSDQAPELIFLDLNMPRMDGIEFVRRLVEHGYAGSVVLLSAEGERVLQMTEKLVRAHRVSILGHLRKPVSRAALAAILQKWQPASAALEKAQSYGAQALRAAMERGELVNHYQPKVAVANATLVGLEALVRWRHPVDGLVSPERFVPVAEEHGLIGELTRRVFSAALAQSAAWRRAGLVLGVAVNVSPDCLSELAFADFVLEAAASLGAKPQDITLELTESRLMLDQRAPLEILARLRLKRFRLAIDDFGTGHSSLAQLRDIAFDELKIDQGFVHGAWRDATARAMYDASLGLGRQLGIEVVAEGVADRDDWDMVRRTGCDLAQGHFIGPPMPAEELAGWMQDWERRSRELRAATR
jgi:EAL domain-containing protein (putative c-di-GMP-specific phosphodiesterase class I)